MVYILDAHELSIICFAHSELFIKPAYWKSFANIYLLYSLCLVNSCRIGLGTVQGSNATASKLHLPILQCMHRKLLYESKCSLS